jgi:hypothetical protein
VPAVSQLPSSPSESPTDKQVKVKVIDRWRVVFDGTVGVKGDTFTVPENVAQE